MRKSIVKLLKKTGEKVAMFPATMKSWPATYYQPKMPKALRDKMD